MSSDASIGSGRRGGRPNGRAAVLIACAAAAALGGAAPAAAKPVPNPAFEPFAHCPARTHGVDLCVVATTTGGEVKLGSKALPISGTITVQGGTMSGTEQLVPATEGGTLIAPPMKVPGGLTGVEGVGGEVTATTELAGPPNSILLNEGNDLGEKGTAVELALKVRLKNELLGEECVIGSEASPLLLHLTTGTTSPPSPNTPISGSRGTISAEQEGNIIRFSGVKLVDNSFSAPAATGCGGSDSFLIDEVVNSDIGLPSASGGNTAILSGSLEIAGAKLVKKAHVLPPKKG